MSIFKYYIKMFNYQGGRKPETRGCFSREESETVARSETFHTSYVCPKNVRITYDVKSILYVIKDRGAVAVGFEGELKFLVRSCHRSILSIEDESLKRI